MTPSCAVRTILCFLFLDSVLIVPDLVQATFKDENGLVEGLTVEKLDKWIAIVKAEHAKTEHSQSSQVAQQLRF